MLIGIPSVLSPELLKLRVDKRTVLGKHAPPPPRGSAGRSRRERANEENTKVA